MTAPPKVLKKDWRGIDLEIGALVIYHGPNMGNLVGKVNSYTSGGLVRLEVLYRPNNRGGQEKHSVPADRCTVVTALPESDLKTVKDANEEAKRKLAIWEANERSHQMPPMPDQPRLQDFPYLNSYHPQNARNSSAYLKACDDYSRECDRIRLAGCSVCGTTRFGVRVPNDVQQRGVAPAPSIRDISCEDALVLRRI